MWWFCKLVMNHPDLSRVTLSQPHWPESAKSSWNLISFGTRHSAFSRLQYKLPSSRCEISVFCLLSFCQSFAQFVDFLKKLCLFFNFINQKSKPHFPQKAYKLSKVKFSNFDRMIGDKKQIFRTLLKLEQHSYIWM